MSTFLQVLKGKKVDIPPVWLMRQAGRYLPEYQMLRKKHRLIDLFKTPKLACEVTLQPLRRFPLDAAIVFADILLPLEALGFTLDFQEGKGPILSPKLERSAQVFGLQIQDVCQTCSYVAETIALLKKHLSIPLIGFAGGPFTLATYLFGSLDKAKAFLYKETAAFSHLIQCLTEVTIAYLDHQISAGVDAVQIFDSWAGLLSFDLFQKYVMSPMRLITEHVAQKSIPCIFFSRASSPFLSRLTTLPLSAISCDWSTPLHVLQKRVPTLMAVQGNFDPQLLKSPPQDIIKYVRQCLNSSTRERLIVNLGHGVPPDTPVEGVQAFVEAVKNIR